MVVVLVFLIVIAVASTHPSGGTEGSSGGGAVVFIFLLGIPLVAGAIALHRQLNKPAPPPPPSWTKLCERCGHQFTTTISTAKICEQCRGGHGLNPLQLVIPAAIFGLAAHHNDPRAGQ